MDTDRYVERGGSVGITHYGQSHSIVSGPEGMEVMNIYLDVAHYPLPRVPAELNEVLPQLIPLHPHFGNRLNRIVRLQFEDPTRAVRHAFDMYDEVTRRPRGYVESARMLFALFLTECCRCAMANGILPSTSAQPDASHPLEPLRRFLDTSFAEHHTLAALSAHAGVSETYLCRAFKRYTGKTLFEYILDRRIQAAMLRLRTTDDKVLHIALSCGFGDISHFNRAFKKRVGTTPVRYREGGGT